MNTKRPEPRKPPRLKPGDAIGIVAPASPFDETAFRSGIAGLEAMDFSVVVPDGLFQKDGYLAGSDAHRADLIHRLFADPAIAAILCARGGFGSIRLLSMLDYDAIGENPKIFAGFSDISALLAAFYAKCGFVTFHAPVLTTLGKATKKTMTALRRVFTSEIPFETTPRQGVVIRPGTASGPVSGGNLTTLCHLLGTPFQPAYAGHILLLEDRGEKAYRIDRMLSQMKLAGCFEGLAGLALGAFVGCGEPGAVFRIAEDIFKEAEIPILAGFDIGHGKTNITIPLGVTATLDTGPRVLRFHEPATA